MVFEEISLMIKVFVFILNKKKNICSEITFQGVFCADTNEFSFYYFLQMDKNHYAVQYTIIAQMLRLLEMNRFTIGKISFTNNFQDRKIIFSLNTFLTFPLWKV